jgi:two-component system, NarL family, sensor histidine kinase DesK
VLAVHNRIDPPGETAAGSRSRALLARPDPAGAAFGVPFYILFWVIGLLALGLAVYAAARLVRVVDEVQASRTDQAELAVARERLRVSRDLHDLLGQSLSAVS